ncbi:hypothetical protein RRG08_020114 [Elysia crispata]|uniref:Uncharacterized protein n=1 Tax=Elysia crispata TaxID=231223 RepID=A0AAE1A4M9_9GAST|nr:hypothetical protein RRG08_020114 [Elysia crispata]
MVEMSAGCHDHHTLRLTNGETRNIKPETRTEATLSSNKEQQEKQIKAVRGVNQYLRQTFHALAQSSACLDLDRRSVSVSVDGRSETAPLELRRSKTDRYRGSIKEYRRKPDSSLVYTRRESLHPDWGTTVARRVETVPAYLHLSYI